MANVPTREEIMAQRAAAAASAPTVPTRPDAARRQAATAISSAPTTTSTKRKASDVNLSQEAILKRRRAQTVVSSAPVKYDSNKPGPPTQVLLKNLAYMEKLADNKPEPVRDVDIKVAAQATSSTSALKQAVNISGPAMPPTKYIRSAAGETWEDKKLLEFDPDDYRIFVGDLGNDCSDDMLAKAFSKYPSFQKARVVRDKVTLKTKGYGFVSLRDPKDFVAAMREMNGKYIGNKPCKLRKSTWDQRNDEKKMKRAQKYAQRNHQRRK